LFFFEETEKEKEKEKKRKRKRWIRCKRGGS
jgi:hypothetical protein